MRFLIVLEAFFVFKLLKPPRYNHLSIFASRKSQPHCWWRHASRWKVGMHHASTSRVSLCFPIAPTSQTSIDGIHDRVHHLSLKHTITSDKWSLVQVQAKRSVEQRVKSIVVVDGLHVLMEVRRHCVSQCLFRRTNQDVIHFATWLKHLRDVRGISCSAMSEAGSPRRRPNAIGGDQWTTLTHCRQIWSVLFTFHNLFQQKFATQMELQKGSVKAIISIVFVYEDLCGDTALQHSVLRVPNTSGSTPKEHISSVSPWLQRGHPGNIRTQHHPNWCHDEFERWESKLGHTCPTRHVLHHDRDIQELATRLFSMNHQWNDEL